MIASRAAIRCRTASADETRALGGAVAGVAAAGDVIVLVGDLGAGKTAFTQGFAAALGVTAPVTSPTFTLANRYEGSITVNHLDVYRFDHPDEAHDLALEELIDDGITLVEWGDAIAGMLPADHLTVKIRFRSDDDTALLHEEPIRLRSAEDASPVHLASDADDNDSGAIAGDGSLGDFRDNERLLTLRARGKRWGTRKSRLEAALRLWNRPC